MVERAWQPKLWPQIIEVPHDPKACVRCGRTKQDEQDDPGLCFNWGVYYEGHLMPKPDGSLELWAAQYGETY